MKQYTNLPENFIKKFVLLATFCVFSVGGFHSLTFPAPNYDELFFYSAATEGHPSCCVETFFFGIPWRLLPYLGALKAWIYAPLMAVSQNIYMIRVPMLVLTLMATLLLQLYYCFPRKKFFSAILFGASSFTIFFSRLDLGEASLFYFLAVVLFLLLNQKAPLRWSLLVSFLGVFHRVNFLAYSLPLYVGMFLREKENRKAIALEALALSLFTILLVGFSGNLHPSRPIYIPYLQFRFWEFISVWNGSLDGSVVINFIFFGIPKHYLENTPILLFSLFLMIPIFLSRKQRGDFLWMFISFTVSCLCIYFVMIANKYWHFLPVWFFYLLCFGCALDYLWDGVSLWKKYLSVFALMLWVGINANTMLIYQNYKNRFPVRTDFTDAIYPLARFCDQLIESKCIIVSSNTYNQLLWSTRQKPKVSFMSATLDLNLDEIAVGIKNIQEKERNPLFIIFHSAALEKNPSESNHFLDALDTLHIKKITEMRIHDSRGIPVYVAIKLN